MNDQLEEVVGSMPYALVVYVMGRSLESSVHRMLAGLALQSTLMKRNNVSITTPHPPGDKTVLTNRYIASFEKAYRG